MCDEFRRQIELFLYYEARLLDEQRHREWLELLTDDAHYWMPVRVSRYLPESKTIRPMNGSTDTKIEELTSERELAIFDETRETLEMRISRLETGLAWSDDPPSRSRHLIGNIEIEGQESDHEIKVFSNFITFRSRLLDEEDFFVGRREDKLRRVNGAWKIASRKVMLDHNLISAKHISVFL